MKLLDIMKDIFTGPEESFEKLLTEEYFPSKRAELNSTEAYAKWLRKIQTKFEAMTYMQKNKGLAVPEKWQEGLRKIEAEVERVKNGN